MKKTIKGILPFLLLVLALTFMTKYKQLDDLTDMETYQIREYVDGTAQSDSASASAQKPETSIAHSSVDGTESADTGQKYSFEIDKSTVIVYDEERNVVERISVTDWKNNKEAYNEKYKF